MSELDLSLDFLGWLRLLVGLPFLLGPGLAAADRWLPKEKGRFILAPVASLSLLTLSAFLTDFLLGIGPSAASTFTASIVLTVALGWARLKQIPAGVQHLFHTGIPLRRPGAKLWLPAIIGFVMLVQALPHIPGDAPDSNWAVYPTLMDRAIDGIAGDDDPYPLHVDEHIHMAFAAKMVRDQVIEINEVYTDQEFRGDLFSVQGFRAERGFTVALVQIHELLDISWGVMFRFLPAIMAGNLSLTVWYLLRPAPGAFVAAAMVALLPSTPRFLGTGFLISSPFALIWIFTTLLVAIRARGPPRFFGIMLLVTAAYFQHLVIGTLSVGAALAAMTLLPNQHIQDRLGILMATLLPALWIVPGIWADIEIAVGDQTALPFDQHIFTVPGSLLYTLAATGALLVFLRPNRENTAHRALAVMAVLMAVSMAWSIQNDHSNDATYSRLLFAFFLSLGILASSAIGDGAQTLARRLKVPWTRAASALLVTVIVLAPAIGAHESQPMYRVHNESSWEAARIFESSGADADDVFLSHPWQAPVYSAATGARPHTVLYPGTPPALGEDWDYYISSGGANATWLAERGISFVVHAPPPNAPHASLGGGVYRIILDPTFK